MESERMKKSHEIDELAADGDLMLNGEVLRWVSVVVKFVKES